MKVTSFKDVETYIYSSVILPLKQLNVPDLPFPTPMRGDDGQEWSLMVRPQPLFGNFRRNYQRTQAQRRADMQVILFTGSKEYVVAQYNRKNKWVKVYQRAFMRLAAMPIYGKLFEAFQKNTPFAKVIPEVDPPEEHRRRRPQFINDSPARAPLPDEYFGNYDERDESEDDDL